MTRTYAESVLSVPPLPDRTRRRRNDETPAERRHRLSKAGLCACGARVEGTGKRCGPCGARSRLGVRQQRWTGQTFEISREDVVSLHAIAEALRKDGRQRVGPEAAIRYAIGLVREVIEA